MRYSRIKIFKRPFSASTRLRREISRLMPWMGLRRLNLGRRDSPEISIPGLEKGGRNARHHRDGQQRAHRADKHPQKLHQQVAQVPRRGLGLLRLGHGDALAQKGLKGGRRAFCR